MSRAPGPARIGRVVGLLAGIALFVGAAEIAARRALPSHYFVWPPGMQRPNETTGEFLHGVWGPARFSINRDGMRGDPYEADHGYALLAVGGSTTICTVLDDEKAWPHLVQTLVEAERGSGAAFVGNVGWPGHTTAQNLLQIEKLLDQYPDLDGILLLAGASDMLIQLNALRGLIRFDAKPDPARALRRAFSVVPFGTEGPWHARLGIAAWLAERGRPPADPGGSGDESPFAKQREARRTTRNPRDELPDLGGALAAYGRKLAEIADVTHAKGARLILLTQPSLWREGLSAAATGRLWLGGPPLDQLQGDPEFYSVRALATALARFNAVMLRVCAERAVECIDLAAAIPPEEDLFWDDVHYTELGSRRMAEAVARHLLATEPLARSAP